MLNQDAQIMILFHQLTEEQQEGFLDFLKLLFAEKKSKSFSFPEMPYKYNE